jgi:putative heme-binding domain-containing protein
MGNRVYLSKRGTDHATNGIRMGIDGWIYIAVGDYGLYKAKGTDGTELTMLGGGIVRVRPDGSEMEIYTHGTRNIYDVAIDPFMNIFTRDNTNDGGGWNIRFSHQIQSGEYGYPTLFKHFTDEILPALVDLGGGSGVGSFYMAEPSWPDKYNDVPMTGDWGRSMLYIHRLTPSGASFTQKQEEFIKMPQITDVDVDGSGRMYLSAWAGAGYSGDSTKGFTVRVVPDDWQYKPFPDIKGISVDALKVMLASESAVGRLAAQQELLLRSDDRAAEAGWAVATNKGLTLAARVAGLFTYAQAAKEDGIDKLVRLTKDEKLREFALRALAGRRPYLKDVPIGPFMKALKDSSERVRAEAVIGLGRLGRKEAVPALLQINVPSSFKPVPKGEIGPHAMPDRAIILPHLAAHALVSIHAADACVKAIGTKNSTLALWALRYMHDPKAVSGLIDAFKNTTDTKLQKNILFTLARLYHKEAPYDGTWWWGTRPDTHGPYYNGITWEASDTIKDLLIKVWKEDKAFDHALFTDLNAKYRLNISPFGGEKELVLDNKHHIDLDKIKNKKGQIGKTSIENVLIAIKRIKGNSELGKKLFRQQGCIACHSIEKGAKLKGPFLGQIGGIMNKEQIAEAILKPNASISQGFATTQIKTKDGKTYVGFVVAQSSDRVVLRDISGATHLVKAADIAERKELKNSMMPAGLGNALSYKEFASLVTFLSQQKE